MKPEIAFKIAILILCCSSAFLNFMTGGWEYDLDIVSAMDWHGFNSQVPHWLKLSIVGPLLLSALVMLSFNVIARNVFAVLSVVGLAISLFEGVATYSALEILILQLYYLSTGIVLALSYTRLNENFQFGLNKKLEQAEI